MIYEMDKCVFLKLLVLLFKKKYIFKLMELEYWKGFRILGHRVIDGNCKLVFAIVDIF